jgi:hypothetical protein
MTMAAKGHSYAEKFSRWELLATNAKAESVQEMPHIATDLASLEGLLTQARQVESQQEDLRSQARELNARLRDITRDGEILRRRLGANLNGKFGFTSETLVRYGFKPRKVSRRSARAEKKVVEAQAAAIPATNPAG